MGRGGGEQTNQIGRCGGEQTNQIGRSTSGLGSSSPVRFDITSILP